MNHWPVQPGSTSAANPSQDPHLVNLTFPSHLTSLNLLPTPHDITTKTLNHAMLPRLRFAPTLAHKQLATARHSLLHTTTTRRSMSDGTDNNPDQPGTGNKPIDSLPAPGDGASAPVLDISGGGGTVSLDALGPVVVNKDGTVSRVTNWAKMTEIEKENTLRILGKRNKQRLTALKEAENVAGQDSDSKAQ